MLVIISDLSEYYSVWFDVDLECLSGSSGSHVRTQPHLDDEDPKHEENEKDAIDEEEQGKKDTIVGEKKSLKHSETKGKGISRPSTRRANHLDAKTQQMLAQLQRLRSQMIEFRQSVHRPPV